MKDFFCTRLWYYDLAFGCVTHLRDLSAIQLMDFTQSRKEFAKLKR
jgi:hypothetical protein